MTLEPNTTLDHFRIIALIGRSGMADVYRAEDTRLGREVALRVLPPEFARDPERVARFVREVRSAARLAHPNIAPILECRESGGLHFYAMALLPGGDLKARIRAHAGGLAAAEALRVAASVARALDYAHGAGLVHRDVKPENILFAADGTAQLTDFRIAHAVTTGTRMTATGMSIGTPHYMSPEQARDGDADGRSDLYSLGAVLYEMLTGSVPFERSDSFAVALAHINDPLPKLPESLSAYQPLLDGLLAKSPDDRYGTGGEVAAACEALERGEPFRVPSGAAGEGETRVMTRTLSGAPASSTPSTGKRGKRRLGRSRLAAVTAGAVVALGLVALLPPVDAPPPSRDDVTGGSAILAVETEPGGAEVLVDGQPVGRTPLVRDDLRPGAYDIELRLADHVPESLDGLALEDGVVLNVSHEFVRGRGRLTLMTTPSGAWIEMGGRRLAESVPVTLDDLPAGDVTLRVGTAGYRPAEVVARVPMDGVGQLEVELVPWSVGDVFRDCPSCPEMVVVPAGAFMMGSPASEGGGWERPRRRVEIARPFAMGVHEVTFAEWEACADDGGCGRRRPGDYGWGRGTRPVINVSWEDVQGYVAWLSRETGEEYRLPSEAEWEYAARAGTETRYSWGDEIGSNRASCTGCGSRWDGERTAPVGSLPPNAWGLYDMHGNVQEWTEDCWNDSYRGAPSDGSAWLSGNCGFRVLRGGGFYDLSVFLRSANRYWTGTGFGFSNVGFRVARTMN